MTRLARGGGPEQLSSARVLWLVAQLSGRRALNRLGNLWRRRPAPGARGATGRRASGGKLLLAFMAVVFAWQTVTTAASLIQRVARLVEQREHAQLLVVDPVTYSLLQLAGDERLPGAQSEAERQALVDRAAARSPVWLSEDAAAARALRVRERFASEGLAGFRESTVAERGLWPSAAIWYHGADAPAMLKPLAVVAFLLALAQVLQHVAGSDEDLARVGPGLEWLFSFPVRARALFLARAVAPPLASPLVWVVLWPFYSVVFGCAGWGVLGLPLGAAAAVYVALWGGGLRVLLETTLRRHLSPIGVSRVQAVLLTFSMLPLAAGYTVAFSPVAAGVLDWAAALGDGALLEPLTLPLALAPGGMPALAAAGVGLALLGLWLTGCVLVAEHMLRDGVTTGAGEHAVQRGGALGVVGRPPGPWRGVPLKEWRSMLRDRRTRAQAFFAPLLLFALEFALNPSLARAISENPRHAAAAAFAVAALSLTTSGFTAFAAEGPALYWLYSFPVELSRSLLDKVWVRALLATGFGLLVLVVAWVVTPSLFWPSLPHALLALAGSAVYAVIAVGIGTLGTDVLEPEPRRRVRPGGVYLFMLLAALYAHAIYTPSPWAKLVQLALSALLAYAVWQKLGERLPFLLDATEAPPPSITVADGVMAALAFFVLQALFVLPFGGSEHTPALVLAVAFVSAGCTVAFAAWLSFRNSRIPELGRALGLRRRAAPQAGLASPIAIGVGSGALAALVALGYLWLGRRLPLLAGNLEEAQRSLDQLDASARLWMLGVAVLAAPVFEEFIFRGILYRGFRRSVSASVAALASAVVFALVHPAATALPVFIMAWLAATVYERTGWLATPIAAHMTYNAILFGSALLG